MTDEKSMIAIDSGDKVRTNQLIAQVLLKGCYSKWKAHSGPGRHRWQHSGTGAAGAAAAVEAASPAPVQVPAPSRPLDMRAMMSYVTYCHIAAVRTPDAGGRGGSTNKN